MLQLLRTTQCQTVYLTLLKNLSYFTTDNSLSGLGQQHLPMVSTTRGTPSTSTDLKEALCEKIPLHHDLLRKFRYQHGTSVITQITIDNMYQGLSGVNTMINYRGLTLPELMSLLPRRGNSPSPEAVFWLLLTGDVPTYEQTASLIADWTLRRQKRREWWLDPGGGVAGTILQALPKNVPPLGRLSIALTALDADKHVKEAVKSGAMSHTHWEYAYEDSMELLATLPAIVSLASNTRDLKNVAEEGDWVDFLLECLGNISKEKENRKDSLGDFLRLYIAINADEDGGVPGAHVTQIVGDSQHGINQALAAGILGYVNEPKSGTMYQYMDFQMKLQNALGRKPKETALIDFMRVFVEKDDGVVGYRESDYCDPRYSALRNHVREHVLEDPEIKLSQEISKVLIPMLKRARTKNIWPEQNAIAAPIFRFYGLRDMEFNQVLFCMSRALGAVASIIWTKAVNMPVEHPKSHCTHTYLNSIEKIHRKPKRNTVKYIKHLPK